jgi:2,3-dihydroxybiphenyl 1,2-dioxygenase
VAEINSLGYFGLGVSDLDQWQSFATEILGMQVGQRDAQGMSLRMDEHQQRIFLEENSIDDLLVAGWQLKTEQALEEFVAELRDKGVEVSAVPAEILQRRKVEKAYACQDPNGFTHEFFFGAHVAELHDSFRSRALKGRFVCGELGVGHILPFAKAGKGAQTLSFYKDVLKLRVSDYIREEIMPGLLVNATFFHTASGRHHSIATAENPVATKTLNHFMLQVEDIDDVGLAYDRAVTAGIPVALERGHHPNVRMFSFYARTPSGFNFEIGWGGVVIDEATWEVRSYSEMSDWGHKRNAIA